MSTDTFEGTPSQNYHPQWPAICADDILTRQSGLSAGDFAALYHSRWRIEEAFKRLKHRLALENTSGLSWLAAQQDFGAKILADNLHSLTVHEAEAFETIKEGYKINRAYAFSHLKRCLPRWLLGIMPSAELFAATLKEIAKNLIGVVPDVSKPRPNQPKHHRKHAYK